MQSSTANQAATVAAAHPVRYLLRAKDLVDARYAEPLDVSDLAREAGLSRAHFSAEFRRAFGESPHVFRDPSGNSVRLTQVRPSG